MQKDPTRPAPARRLLQGGGGSQTLAPHRRHLPPPPLPLVAPRDSRRKSVRAAGEGGDGAGASASRVRLGGRPSLAPRGGVGRRRATGAGRRGCARRSCGWRPGAGCCGWRRRGDAGPIWARLGPGGPRALWARRGCGRARWWPSCGAAQGLGRRGGGVRPWWLLQEAGGVVHRRHGEFPCWRWAAGWGSPGALCSSFGLACSRERGSRGSGPGKTACSAARLSRQEVLCPLWLAAVLGGRRQGLTPWFVAPFALW